MEVYDQMLGWPLDLFLNRGKHLVGLIYGGGVITQWIGIDYG
jgi:hypothetical protein